MIMFSYCQTIHSSHVHTCCVCVHSEYMLIQVFRLQHWSEEESKGIDIYILYEIIIILLMMVILDKILDNSRIEQNLINNEMICSCFMVSAISSVCKYILSSIYMYLYKVYYNEYSYLEY